MQKTHTLLLNIEDTGILVYYLTSTMQQNRQDQDHLLHFHRH